MSKYYFTTEGFVADNPDLPQGDLRKTKFFKAASLVMANEDNIQGDRVVISQDGYTLPEQYLREVTDPSAIESLQNMQASVKKIMSGDMVSDMVRSNQYSIAGSSVGAVVGILLAIFTRRNIFWCGFAGTIGGGFVGYGVSKVKKK